MNNKLRNFRLLFGSVLSAGVLPAQAVLAQDQASATDSGLDVIIVTAQKREQSVQDVPIAVTALTGDALSVNRITTVADLSALAPGVTVRQAAGGTRLPSFTIRGAVSYGVVPGSDKQVSIYLDGVYISAPRGSIFDLPDVERIELLRGPQGTLFGRNATAGAVSVSTREPGDEFGARATGTIGNHDHHRVQLSIDLPKVGPLSGYVSYVNSHTRGDIRNLGAGMVWDRTASAISFNRGIHTSPKWLGTKDDESWFAALKFESGDFKTVYKFDRFDYHGSPIGAASIAYNPTGLGPAIADMVANNPVPIPFATDGKRPDTVWNSYIVPNDSYVEGHSLTSTYEVSSALSLKNIAAYRKSNTWGSTPLGGLSALTVTPLAVIYLGRFGVTDADVGQPITVVGSQAQSYSKQWSEELQFNYNSDFLTATVGAMWFQSKDWSNQAFLPGTQFFGVVRDGVFPNRNFGPTFNKATSMAAYTQLEFHLTPRLDVVLGGRITRDKKSGYVAPGTVLGQQTFYRFTYKDTRPNYLIGVNYKPTEDILVYGKFSTAYVSGGSTGGIPFPAETARSFEGGVKAELLDRKLRANLALYHARYKNFQTAQSGAFFSDYVGEVTGDPTLGAKVGTIVLPQGGPVTAKGFEFDFTGAPIKGVTLGGSLSYEKTKFKDVNPALLAYAGGVYEPTYRPHWTGTLWGQVETQPLIGDAFATFRLGGNYQSRMLFSANPEQTRVWGPGAVDEPGYWVLNGRIALRELDLGGVKTELAVWGKNLTDERAKSYVLAISNIVAGANFIPARSYGVDLTVEY